MSWIITDKCWYNEENQTSIEFDNKELICILLNDLEDFRAQWDFDGWDEVNEDIMNQAIDLTKGVNLTEEDK